MDVDESFAARRITEAGAQLFGENVGDGAFDELLDGGVHGAANLSRAEGADGFVNGNDAADFGGIGFAIRTERLDLRINHFEARGAELIDFDFAVQDEKLAGLEAAFEIAAMKEFARKQPAGGILNEQVINSIVSMLIGDGLAAHDAGANGVRSAGLDILYV